MENKYIIAATCTCLAVASLNVGAATISGISIINNSDADEATVTLTGRVLEFHTADNIGTVANTATSSEFTSQFQWYNGFVGTGGFAQTHPKRVRYDLLFTVEDPTNQGYDLSITSNLLGYSTSIWGSGDPGVDVVATSTSLSGRIDDGNTTLADQLNALTILGGPGSSANLADPYDNVEQIDGAVSGPYEGSLFSGTQSFALRFTSDGSPTTNVFMGNNWTGQGSVRYGLSNSLGELNASGQAQTGDTLTSAELGHFVTVQASTTSVVPIPAAIWLFGSGLLGLVGVARRKEA